MNRRRIGVSRVAAVLIVALAAAVLVRRDDEPASEPAEPADQTRPAGSPIGGEMEEGVDLFTVYARHAANVGKAAIESGAPRDRIEIVDGPLAVVLGRNDAAGTAWDVRLGDARFRVCIEDGLRTDDGPLTLDDVAETLERIPAAYRRALEIVSEEGKDGVSFYGSLDGSVAHGSKDYLNVLPRAGPHVFLHEAGHVIEQRASESDPGILDRWDEAIAADRVSVSDYGDTVRHEDQAEFAMLYGGCMDAGSDVLAALRAASPRRAEDWERMLESARVARSSK